MNNKILKTFVLMMIFVMIILSGTIVKAGKEDPDLPAYNYWTNSSTEEELKYSSYKIGDFITFPDASLTMSNNPAIYCLNKTGKVFYDEVLKIKIKVTIHNDHMVITDGKHTAESYSSANAALAYILSHKRQSPYPERFIINSLGQRTLWKYVPTWKEKAFSGSDMKYFKDKISVNTASGAENMEGTYYDANGNAQYIYGLESRTKEKEAQAFGDYIVNYKNKENTVTGNDAKLEMDGNAYKFGPFNAQYYEASYGNVLFSGIENISIVVEKNSKEETWNYLENGKKTGKFEIIASSGTTTNGLPKPGNFYIKISDTQVEKLSNINIKLKNMNVDAEWYYAEAYGSQDYREQTIAVLAYARRYYDHKEVGIKTDIDTTFELGGNVFLDGLTGKGAKKNSIYNEADDELVSGVEVALYKEDGTLAELMQVDGEIRTNPTITNENGYYQFKGIKRSGKYYVRFTYNGQIYTDVEYMEGGISNWDINSKATELSKERAQLNSKYSNIGAYPNQYKSTNSLGYGLEYNIAYPKYVDSTSKELRLASIYDQIEEEINKYINQNKKYPNVTTEIYPIIIRNNSSDTEIRNKLQFIEDCKLNAYTGVNDQRVYYPNETANSKERLDKINLGITERPEFDLMVNKDIYSATVAINGKTQEYICNSRENLGEDLWTMEIRTTDAYNKNYIREIYKSDYQFRIKDYDDLESTGMTSAQLSEDLELKVFITYKITIRNQDQIAGTVTKFAEYFDKDYTYKSAYIGDRDANKIKDINFSEDSQNVSNQYNKLVTQDIGELKANERMYIYVIFEVNKDANGGIILDDENSLKNNHIEIIGYSNAEGIIDKDSIAGNYNPDEPTRNDEDDSASAPGIQIKLKEEERAMTGYVWEDNTAVTEKSGGAKVGNGIKENGENPINGVIVQLIEQKEQKLVIWEETMTSNDGYYQFGGFIPANYQVRFIYGDGKETVLTNDNGGMNTVSYNGQDYKSTVYSEKADQYWYTQNTDQHLSDARDNWERREQVNNYSKTVTNYIAEVLKMPYKSPDNQEYLQELIENTAMLADTALMAIEVEYPNANNNAEMATSYTVNNIDFGLAKRPISELKLVKDVANVKLTLANGTVLFDNNEQASNLSWVKPSGNNNGKISLTVDDELIHGSTIEITYKMYVENIGEVDYVGDSFYYTGEYDGSEKVKVAANEVVDYVENNLVFDKDKNSNWEIITPDKLKDESNGKNSLIRNDIDVTSYQTIIRAIDGNKLLTETAAGDKTQEETLILTKLISTTSKEDSLTYDNSAEILKTTSTNGRKLETSIPGNYDPVNGLNISEPDTDNAEQVIILPPFGQQIIYYTIGITLGAILVIGIVLIKKKVIK